MPNERRIRFDPFALDLTNECVWEGARAVKLRPKAIAVLAHLISRPGELVTKEHLIATVWPDTAVGDAVLKVAIRQIREALADDPRAPRFIETAHRRGYRFIASLSASRGAAVAETRAVGEAARQRSGPADLPAAIVGREAAMAELQALFARARAGFGQMVFVTGEAGLGKTTLLDAFASSVAADPSVRLCSGQCLAQYGMSEPYLPVLDAIRQLCRNDSLAVDVLRRHAPMWLMQLPSLLTPADHEAFSREAAGATPERMLREMGDALDALAADAALVLVLEDLHWSDFSTLDLISYVARRRRASRLMVIGTYRPAELILSGHPLRSVKQELLARQQCEELPLEYLSGAAVAKHLAARFPENQFPAELPALIRERTEGNPLFMVNIINHLIAERLIRPADGGWWLAAPIDAIKVGVPDSIRQLIETQFDRLDGRDQRLLEAGSVAGIEFPAAAVAAALEGDPRDVEIRCEDLSRRHQFIKDCGAHLLPNGDISGRFAFVHALYQNVLYERMSVPRRLHAHDRIGRRGEELYGDRSDEIAAELAMHFEQAGDRRRAAHYLQRAAVNAMQRSAYRDAITLSRRGLDALAHLPDTDDRARQQLQLQITLGVPLIATAGYAAAAVGAVYLESRAIGERLGATPELAQALWGLWTFHALKAELSEALDIARETLELAERVGSSSVEMRGHWSMEITCTHQGRFGLALEHFDRALLLYDAEPARADGFLDALNPGVAMRGFAGWALWFVGQPDRALRQVRNAVALARQLAEPHSLAHALLFAAILHQLRKEPGPARRYADEATVLSGEHGLVLYQAMARIVRGWSRLGRGDDAEAAAEMRDGLSAWQSTGAELMRPHFLALLADAWPQGPGDDQGLAVLEEALTLTESTGERYYEAELHRLKGERLLARDQWREAAACFEQSLAIARREGALSLELRAAMSLTRLRRVRAESVPTGDLLRPVLDQFTEGLDTPDLREARALLE